MLNGITLTRSQKRVGVEFFQEMDEWTYRLLIECKIIRACWIVVGATVFPEDVKCSSDVNLLNKKREWLVRSVKMMGKRLGQHYRA